MKSPVIRKLAKSDAIAELEELKARSNMPLEEMECRARSYELSEREAGLWERISDLIWLTER